MGTAAIRKGLSIILMLSLFLSVFLGGYYHTCECYSQTCTISQQASHQPFLFSTATTAADEIRPFPVRSEFVLSAEILPDPSTAYAPLSGRAPPRSA